MVVLGLAALGSRAAIVHATPAVEPGVLTGTVRFVGPLPRLTPVTIKKDRHVCGEQQTPERLVVGPDGGVRDAVIRIRGVESTRKTELALVLDIRRCRFVPHVAGIAVGTRVRVRNSDAIVHTARGTMGTTALFNVALPGEHQEVDVTRRLVEPGIVHVRSDTHPAMSAWLVVHDTAYVATTDGNGTFRIDGIPPGTYTVTMWHEGFRPRARGVKERDEPVAVDPPAVTMNKRVTIEPTATATVDFEIRARGARGRRER